MTNDELPATNDEVQRGFRVYPNPTDGKFIVEYMGKDKPGNVKKEIFGMKGDRVLTESFSGERRHEFTLAGRPAGIYLVRMVSDRLTKTVRIIKQ